jgi:AcrR family transcriptional regulator
MFTAPMLNHRERIIQAAVRVYGEVGFRGATTRRIAAEAGVNEVTLFRLFGSKAALMDEALKCAHAAAGMSAAQLPERPGDPVSELTAWATGVLEHLHNNRSVIRTTMGELEEHPELASCACEGPNRAFASLYSYTAKLRKAGVTLTETELRGAVAMLIGALFADAMGRDFMPTLYRQPPRKAAAMCVRLFLRAIGYNTAESTAAPARKIPVHRSA